jgi:hypothetical protein
VELRLDIRTAVRWLAIVIAALGLAHFSLAHLDSPIFRLVNLDEEGSFGTWFGSFLPLMASCLSLWIARRASQRGMTWIWWSLLGFVLLALSIDEVAQVHEGISTRLGEEFRGVVDVTPAGTPLVGLAILPLLLFGIVMIWRTADAGAARLIIIGLVVFWAAAFGVEELEYINYTGDLFLTRGIAFDTSDRAISGVQEVGEMAGIAMVVVGLLRQLAAAGEPVGIQILDSRRRSKASSATER